MQATKTFKGITDLLKQIPDEKAAAQYWASLRWENGKAICPYCFSDNVGAFSDGIRYKCREVKCRQKFSIRVGTIMESSRIPILKWIMAIYLLTESRKGISSIQLAEMIGVTQKTAWFLAHRLRASMKEKHSIQLCGIIEADATFFGGKMKNMHASQRAKLANKAGFVHMTPVFGMIQRGGKVVTHVVASESGECVAPLICETVTPQSYLVTDGANAFKALPKGSYTHRVVHHAKGEYARGCWDSNSIESFWAVVKRGYHGIYHHWSVRHLDRYMVEFTYRHNLRENGKNAKFNGIFKQSEGRLTYAQLIGKEQSMPQQKFAV